MTTDDWAAAEELAGLLGVPTNQMVSELALEYDALTPGEKAELAEAIARLDEVLPGLHQSLDRVERGLSKCRSTVRDLNDRMATTAARISRLEEVVGIAPAG
ncbi:MAG: hypothetical protein K2Y17_04815 [Qipengyuania sp.]|nr:hypothetical protein [Qipengyuania sp.]